MKIYLLIFSLVLCGSVFAQSPSYLWAQAAGGTNYDEGTSVTTDVSGNVFVTGYFQSPTITFGTTTLTNEGGFDLFIVKYDVDGNVLWAKGAGGAADEVGNSITTDVNGNVLVTGYFYSSSITFGTTTLTNSAEGSNDIFVLKLDTNGDVLWAKKEGGTYYDYGKSISTDSNGNVVVAGNFSSESITFGTDEFTNNSMFGWDLFIVKYDADGNVLWAQSEGGTGGEYMNSVSTDSNGAVVITGYFYGSSIQIGTNTITNSGSADTDSDIFVAKYDAGGNVEWAKSEGGLSFDVGYSITTDADGNVFVAGAFKGDSFTFGTITITNSGSDSYDVLILKYDANGNALWATSAEGTGHEYANSIATDADGAVFITGYFYSPSLTFGTTVLTNASPAGNYSDLFIVKCDGDGNVLWALGEGGTNNDVAFGLHADTDNTIFVTGYFHSDIVTFGTSTLTNSGGSIFVAKLGDESTGTAELEYGSKMKVFPNPFSSSITLQANSTFQNATVVIFDSFGRAVKEIQAISGNSVHLTLDHLATGTYVVHLVEAEGVLVDKIVIVKE